MTHIASMSYTDAATCHSTVAPVIFFCAYPDRILVLQGWNNNNNKIAGRVRMIVKLELNLWRIQKKKFTNFERIFMGLIEIIEFKI